jgi:hypothetical protein
VDQEAANDFDTQANPPLFDRSSLLAMEPYHLADWLKTEKQVTRKQKFT